MAQYLLKRFLLLIPTLLGIVTVCFLFTQAVPGGPVDQLVASMKKSHGGGEVASGGGQARGDTVTFDQEQIDRYKALYGLDQPLHIQYFNWIKRLVTFDFGESFYVSKKVTTLIAEKLPVSASLGISSLLLAYLISIPLGIRKAVHQGSRFDTASSLVILVAYSVPGFVLAIFLLVLFGGGSFWSVFPLRGLTSDNFAELSRWGQIKDYLWHLILPVTAYSINAFAWLTLLTRNLFLDEIGKQYVTTARAKGLPEKVILWKHIFRNAMILIISGFPGAVIFMFFGGSLLIETVFSLDGLGLLTYQSVQRRDYAFVLGSIFLFSLLGLLAQIVSDLVLVWVDPRISFDKARG